MEKNNAYVEVLAKIASLMGRTKVFIHDGFINADGYGVIIGEDSDGMIQKSNGIGNWMKEGIYREATREEIQNFFAKIRKTQKIINY